MIDDELNDRKDGDTGGTPRTERMRKADRPAIVALLVNKRALEIMTKTVRKVAGELKEGPLINTDLSLMQYKHSLRGYKSCLLNMLQYIVYLGNSKEKTF